MIRLWHDPDQKLARLASIPIFRGCGVETCRLLGRISEEILFPAGAVVEREGAPGTGWQVIYAGSALTSQTGRPLGLLGPGDFWGEVPILAARPVDVTVTALTSMTLYAFNRREFLSLLTEVPVIAVALLRHLVNFPTLVVSSSIEFPRRIST